MSKNLDRATSKFLCQFAPQIAERSPGPVLDVPCGYGRNALHMAELGCTVYCVDNNQDALDYLASLKQSDNCFRRRLKPKFLNLDDEWPFEEMKFGAILNIHFVAPKLVAKFAQSLKVGGFLLVETFENRGRNYLELPQSGIYRELLNDFELIFYEEKPAGPVAVNAVTVRLFAQKK